MAAKRSGHPRATAARAPRRGFALAAAILIGCALGVAPGLAACATCPREPPVRPRAGGSVSTGTGGFWSRLWLAVDLSPLFCRQPPGRGDAPEGDERPRR